MSTYLLTHHLSPLSRVPIGYKFAALIVVGVLLYLIPTWWMQLGALALAVAVIALARIPVSTLARTLLWIVLTLSVFAVFAGFTGDWNTALRNFVRFLALAMLALAISTSTSTTEVVDMFTVVVAPLRVVGVRPERVALTLALALRLAPRLVQTFSEVREAQRARGIRQRITTAVTPFVYRALLDANDISDAIDARGFGNDLAENSTRARRGTHTPTTRSATRKANP